MWFRLGRGCIDQVFAVRQVCESILRMGKMYFGRLWIKAYDTIDRHGHVADAKSMELEGNC